MAASANKKFVQLGETDMRVSAIGFGASPFASIYETINEQEAISALREALKCGINYIDTATAYGSGKSELLVGEALKDIPRESYYIATKVCRLGLDPAVFDFSYNSTLVSVDESLTRLGLSYVDVIQAHDVEFAPSLDIVLNETLPALQRVKDEGKARYIGITGYPLDVLKEIVERSKVKIDTVLTYCRYSMNDTTLLQYKDFFSSKGVGIINASPMSMGLLTSRGPPEWHPARHCAPEITEACSQAVQYCVKEGVDIARLAIYFGFKPSFIGTCLVGMVDCNIVHKNVELETGLLSEKEQQVLEHVLEKFMKPLNNAEWSAYEMEIFKRS